jgi:hypothetical protein
MTADLASLFNLYVFPTGRRLFAHAQVLKLAQQQGIEDLASHASAAIKQDRKTLALEQEWGSDETRPLPDADATRIDNLLDRALSAFRDAAQALADGADPEDEIIPMVNSLLKAIFPAGVAAVTTLPFVEELAVVEGILAKLKGPLKKTVDELGLSRQVKRLAKLAEQYRAALTAPSASLKFGDVRAARARGQDMLLETVVIILARHRSSSAEDMSARSALLEPVLNQNDEIRRYMRSRRTVADVNPETGQPDSVPPTGAGEATPVPKGEGG